MGRVNHNLHSLLQKLMVMFEDRRIKGLVARSIFLAIENQTAQAMSSSIKTFIVAVLVFLQPHSGPGSDGSLLILAETEKFSNEDQDPKHLIASRVRQGLYFCEYCARLIQ